MVFAGFGPSGCAEAAAWGFFAADASAARTLPPPPAIKKIFLYFYADWCHYCKMMQQATLSNKDVIHTLNSNFICIRVNSEQQAALASQYQVVGVPVSWFLESSGSRIGAQPGLLLPDQMKEVLQFVLSEKYKKQPPS